MNESTAKLLDKSGRSLSAGGSLLTGGHLEAAAGRAYYAMYYVAEALLNERGLHFRKHGGVHGAFGEHFVKTGLLDPRFHRWLLAAFNKRITADYGVDVELSDAEVDEMLAQAREFLDVGRRFLERGP
jgi:uncharacterized protein (UPF0332 family)